MELLAEHHQLDLTAPLLPIASSFFSRLMTNSVDRSSCLKNDFVLVFFLWYGRSRSEARSLHVKKQFKITSTLTPVVM